MIHRNPLESMIHRNPVVIEFGSESAAQSIIHRKTVVIEFGSESAAQSILPGHSPSQSSSNTSFQVAEIQTSLASISGRQSGLGRVYHPPNQICHPSKSSLSIIHRPGPHHRSLAPPSEGAPSTDHHDLVNENILRFRLSLGASHTWSCCDDA